jgi:hypothetical protein
MQVVSREGNVQSAPRIAPILRAASCAADAAARRVPGGVGDPQRTSALQRPPVPPLTPSAQQNRTYLDFTYATSPVLDDGRDPRVRAAKAAPGNATGQEHLYRHFNEWSRAQQKQ